MKSKKRTKSNHKDTDELRPHYDFDYSKAKPNRFAKLPKEQMIVLVDKDIRKVFRTPEAVQHALRSLIDAMPVKSKRH